MKLAKKLQSIVLTGAIFISSIADTFAAGGDDPYHVPIDTALVGEPMYVIGLVLITAGILFLLNAKTLKNKINNA